MIDRPHASLDLARSTGFTVGVPFQKPYSETWRLKGKTRGERYADLRRLMITAFARFDPAIVFIEEPLPPRVLVDIGATHDTAMQLPGYVAVAEMIAEVQGVRSIMVERRLVLKHFVGRSSFGEEDGAKKACVARCQQLRYAIEGYDQADSAAQWDYGCAMIYRTAYATVKANLPVKVKGHDDARLPGARGFTRRRKPKRRANPSLFDNY